MCCHPARNRRRRQRHQNRQSKLKWKQSKRKMPDIRIDKLSFTYAGSSEPVLRALNLVIPEGEFVLLTGPSGCGKTTLALALAGLIPSRIGGHLRGSVYLGAENISTMSVHE